ncbi:hypothetical protein WOLCODRAFT_152215 [Wolfiporia cocos MD-104 SS10]|uniref:Uncharacterized protein n=1 Tax=Wolfiporia cocos (strain MD-104) TaxID=742152 RepID=A0A2H3JTF9_WOLCO|nr:hypothetical protein WOLCODRAFT_152215 [Wolfiporia cocos MD-104 SS10]
MCLGAKDTPSDLSMETLRPARGDGQLRVTMEMTNSSSCTSRGSMATHFQLYKRTRQSLGRVANTLTELGMVLDASHQNAGEARENSRPKADELVRPAKEASAYGRRTTGTGWGSVTHLYAQDVCCLHSRPPRNNV